MTRESRPKRAARKPRARASAQADLSPGALRMRRLRGERVEAGLCPQCGIDPPRAGGDYCGDCTREARLRQRRRQRRLRH